MTAGQRKWLRFTPSQGAINLTGIRGLFAATAKVWNTQPSANSRLDPLASCQAPLPSRFSQLTEHIPDEVFGPTVMCVGTFLPFQTTYYINGHHYIEGELRRHGIRFHKDDNAFLGVSDRGALQAAADSLSAAVIRKRLDYWTLVLGPKFFKKQRAAINVRREYSINQAEYCRNFVFRRSFPIHKIFERS